MQGAMLASCSEALSSLIIDGNGANRIRLPNIATANQIRFVVDAGGNQASEFFVLMI